MDYKHLIALKGYKKHLFTYSINYSQRRKRRGKRSRRTMRERTKKRIAMLEGTVADQNTKLATLRHKVIFQEGLLQAKEFSKVFNEDLAFTFHLESEKMREINTRLIQEVSDKNEDLFCARNREEKLEKQLKELQLQFNTTRTFFKIFISYLQLSGPLKQIISILLTPGPNFVVNL